MAIATPTLQQFNTVQTPAAAAMTATNAAAAVPMTAAQSAAAAQMQVETAGNAATINPNSVVTPQAETIESRLPGILNSGGALMQTAATAGRQQAASRGLLNSSMGVQAAQQAVVNAAGQIAGTDAASVNQMATTNANALNQTNQFNAQATNATNQFNANTLNQGSQFNAQATNQTNQFNATNEQQASQTNAQAQNSVNQFNANTQNQASQFNTQATNDFAKLNTQNQNTANQWNAQQANDAVLKTMDINSREQLANIEANYKQLMQTNSSAETMYSQVMKNISDIQNNKDVADKATAIESQMSWLRSGLTMIQNLNGVSGLVTF